MGINKVASENLIVKKTIGQYMSATGDIKQNARFGYVQFTVKPGEIYQVSGIENLAYTTRGIITSATGQKICLLPYTQTTENEFYIPGRAARMYVNFPAESAETVAICLVEYEKGTGNDPLFGKKLVSFGDSITRHNFWQPIVADYFGLRHFNCGISGSRVGGTAAVLNDGHTADAFFTAKRLELIKVLDPDILFIAGGVNDCYFSIPLGAERDIVTQNKDTFVGAYSYILDTLTKWKPSMQIYVLSTLHVYETGANKRGLYYRDYTQGCIDVANYWGAGLIDTGNRSGINNNTQRLYTFDGTHLNARGAEHLADFIIKELR